MTTARAVAAWTGPAALALVASHVFAGHPTAPLAALLVAVAPCVALVRACDALPATTTHAALALPGLAAIVAANAALIGEFARAEALPWWLAPGVACVFALLPLAPSRPSAWNAALGIGLVGALAPLVAVAAVTTAPPWTAWQRVASRAALVFDERGEWVTSGRAIAMRTTLAFDEPQRVTAGTNAVWRVTEREVTREARAVTRERRVATGDVVAFRPGDQLLVEPGARLRFEAGKRVPGTVASGVVWADPPERRGPGGALLAAGLVLGLLGAAVALVPPVRGERTAPAFAAALPLVFGTAAVASGVYAMYVSPDIALGAGPATVLHRLPRAVLSGTAAAPLVAASGVAVLALHAASAASLLARVRAALPGADGVSTVVWVAITAGAGGAVLSGIGAATWLMLGVGLLASAWTAPLLAGGSPRATTIGAAVGAAVFAVGAAVGMLRDVEILRDQAVILAAPAAWAVAAALGRASDSTS